MPFGLYVHVPFCAALCPYCDFAVVVGRADSHEEYCSALVAEARAHAWGADADTVFIGGGTPSLIDPSLLARTLDELFAIVPPRPDAEITLEANPESVTAERARAWRDAGINRVSIGAQSFDTQVLAALGRTHAVEDIARAVTAVRDGGIDNISVDLISGGPGETDASWAGSLAHAVALGVEHLSCYALTIEPRTAFGTAVARGAMRAPDDDRLAARYEHTLAALADAGFTHYEHSNWARPGRESRHNLLYWTQGDYLGLGVGAHSHHDGHRWWNERALRAYLDAPQDARAGEEHLDAAQRADEWLSLRLRLVEGIDLAEAEARLGRPLPVHGLVRDGLAEVREGRLVLTARGMLLENDVTLLLLDPASS